MKLRHLAWFLVPPFLLLMFILTAITRTWEIITLKDYCKQCRRKLQPTGYPDFAGFQKYKCFNCQK